MKTTVKKHKLNIDRETLVALDARALAPIRGGADDGASKFSCTVAFGCCPPSTGFCAR